jgi:hypothetical protein
MRERPGSSDVE